MALRSRFRVIGSNIAHNFAFKIRRLAGDINSWSGSTHYGLGLEESLAYIQKVYGDYLSYAGLNPSDLTGRRVLEIGPGDSFGVALKFLAAGCTQVVCLDRLASRRDAVQQLAIYRALREHLSASEQLHFDQAAALDPAFTPNPERLRSVCGTALEDASSLFPPESFDYIVSRAVLMEIGNIDGAFASMDRLLKPGGCLIHKIAPVHDYRMFRAYGYGPLEFLTVPEWMYRRMVSECGGPNRRPVTYYRRKMAELGYDATLHLVSLIGSDATFRPGVSSPPRGTQDYLRARAEIEKARPRLQPEFRAVEDDDLMVEDLFLVARKPAPNGRPVCACTSAGRDHR